MAEKGGWVLQREGMRFACDAIDTRAAYEE